MFLGSYLRRLVNKYLRKFGFQIEQSLEIKISQRDHNVNEHPMNIPTELNFHGSINGLKVFIRPGAITRQTNQAAIWEIRDGDKFTSETVWYSSFGLQTLLQCYQFNTVLDIGSHRGTIPKILQAFGKKVTTIEVLEGFPTPDYKSNYLDTVFSEKFDCIWCSHILEHQLNVGQFLDKCYNDLRVGGILAVTVPCEYNNPKLSMGHSVYFSPWSLTYNVAAAGFDTRKAAIAVYLDNITMIVYKPNHKIEKKLGFAPYPPINLSEEDLAIHASDHSMSVEQFKKMQDSAATHNLMDFLPQLDQEINWVNWPLNTDGSINEKVSLRIDEK